MVCLLWKQQGCERASWNQLSATRNEYKWEPFTEDIQYLNKAMQMHINDNDIPSFPGVNGNYHDSPHEIANLMEDTSLFSVRVTPKYHIVGRLCLIISPSWTCIFWWWVCPNMLMNESLSSPWGWYSDMDFFINMFAPNPTFAHLQITPKQYYN